MNEPTAGPRNVPAPPKRVMMTICPEVMKWMFSIGTVSPYMIASAPATPDMAPLIVNAMSRTFATL